MLSIKAPCREIVPIILLFSILILLVEFKASVLEILLFSIVFSIDGVESLSFFVISFFDDELKLSKLNNDR